MTRRASSRLVSTTRSAPSRLSLCRLAGIARGGDHGRARELRQLHGRGAHAARRAGDEDVVVHPHVEPVGDDAVGGRARPHRGGALVEIERGRRS